MTDHPIIFTTPMVQAILAGSKTQTRRVIKSQWSDVVPKEHSSFPGYWIPYTHDGKLDNSQPGGKKDDCGIKCPYGVVGDRLWVRETWMYGDLSGPHKFYYKATEPKQGTWFKWHPSIHMPKEATRLWLEIINVRAERVQDISEKDAITEGMIAEGWTTPPMGSIGLPDKIKTARFPIGQFANYWDSINNKRGYGWDLNPFVWVISFRRLDL